jgi:hypothetical protein
MLSMASRSRGGAAPPAPPAPAEALLDVYRFPLSSTASELPERIDCEKQEAQQAAKWAKWHKQRKLPPKDTLKKLCRKVRDITQDTLSCHGITKAMPPMCATHGLLLVQPFVCTAVEKNRIANVHITWCQLDNMLGGGAIPAF